MDAWLDFYRPYFPDNETLRRFVVGCEQLKPDDPGHRAKLMMHQGQLLLTIADAMGLVVSGREPLKLLFLLIASENISKLHDAYDGEGNSKHYVKRFFNEFCVPEDKLVITHGIERCGQESSLEDLIVILYDVRCDVVHEGTYWGFDFATLESPSILTGIHLGQVLRVKMRYEEFRDIVARGIVVATQQVIAQHAAQ
ncbi:MAG: hypothetical protein Q8K57_15745 [Thiobacillus sp.]|nr:hypothetical protein [Thiobacillus sp.]